MAALAAMLDKERCQLQLAAGGIPIPRFAVVTKATHRVLTSALEGERLDFPVVVKPPTQAGSVGVSIATHLEELAHQVDAVIDQYGPRVMLEEYLEGLDLTVAVFATEEETLLLPTWYEVGSQNPGPNILDLPKRLKPWGAGKRMRCISDLKVIEQVEAVVPRAVRVLGIRDITRVDGRLDARGVLRLFDVNGMPGLEDPESVIVKQVMAAWDGVTGSVALERLICTVVASATRRHGFETPAAVAAKAFFRQSVDVPLPSAMRSVQHSDHPMPEAALAAF
jgi:D-alanine-D-alanine ligase-like ATP-grasp enzyme